ncbi:hypothetical protein TeGR_g13437 [Tetraparma gracilis]|uniref:Cyclic nucleotide-binding domain-containing protein n=1 Tax=Tetraparma gracilis TaxID=2962635 RepID=A0ABQ6MPA2_9STRA|nr:hypothetical protein TeGR_g13437 [Tetraparma gracilis]
MKTIATSRQPAYVNPDAEFDDPESEAEVSSIGRSKANKTKTKSFVAPTSESPLGKVVRTIASNASDSPLGKAARTMTKSSADAKSNDAVEGASNNEVYTDAENAVVDRVRDQLGSIHDSSFEKFESPDHFVEMGVFHKGGKNGTPRASTVLDEDICTYLSAMRKRFDKSPAIDAARILNLVAVIQNHDSPYTEKEKVTLRVFQAQFAVFGSQKGKELKMPLPGVKAKVAFKAGDSRAFGFVTTTVRARLTEVPPLLSSAEKVLPLLPSAKKVLPLLSIDLRSRRSC